MGYTWELQLKIYKYTLIVTLFIAILMGILLSSPLPFIYGLVFGTLINMLNFRTLALTLEKAVTMNPGRAQAYTASRYFIRFLINGIVIFISIKAPYINILGTIVGLLMIKGIILFTNLFSDISFLKRILIRKEEE